MNAFRYLLSASRELGLILHAGNMVVGKPSGLSFLRNHGGRLTLSKKSHKCTVTDHGECYEGQILI